MNLTFYLHNTMNLPLHKYVMDKKVILSKNIYIFFFSNKFIEVIFKTRFTDHSMNLIHFLNIF